MCSTIKFDNDATFRTIKVRNVRTYSVLASELLSVELRVLQTLPKESLRRRKVMTKFKATMSEFFDIVN